MTKEVRSKTQGETRSINKKEDENCNTEESASYEEGYFSLYECNNAIRDNVVLSNWWKQIKKYHSEFSA